jgi:type IV pilus assembly protein PilA
MTPYNSRGFTLIEPMIVIAIIGILTTMAVPSYQDRVIRSQIEEAFTLAEIARAGISECYKTRKAMPKNNMEAGLPAPEKIIGNYVTGLSVTDGVIDIRLGNRINANVKGKTVTIRPAVVKDEPRVPIAWVYAYAGVPNGMTVLGKNSTTVAPRHLPVNCRY